MHFSNHDLLQMDDEFIEALSHAEQQSLCKNMLADLKQAKEQLGQNPTNSSAPPSTRKPWDKGDGSKDEVEDDDIEDDDIEDAGTNKPDNETGIEASSENAEDKTDKGRKIPKKKGKPGKRYGAKGYGRKLEMDITGEEQHYPASCSVCNKNLTLQEAKAWTAFYVVDLILSSTTFMGLKLSHIKHVYHECKCECGHITRKEPGRCEDEDEWSVSLTEWRLVGPTMVSFFVCLSKNHRMSLSKISEFTKDWLGLHLCKATINQCLHEAGRAASPLENEIISEIVNSTLIHADETSWHEGKRFLWLWVFSSEHSSLFFIKSREKEVANLILENFTGWLMSDGYLAYRFYPKRLRCWAHLIRKAIGLEDSLSIEAINFGKYVHKLLDDLIDAIYEARNGKIKDIKEVFSKILNNFKNYCYRRYDSPHDKTKALAREFLNDWEAIWSVLSNVDFPITNNIAETSLRHWVINRKIGLVPNVGRRRSILNFPA